MKTIGSLGLTAAVLLALASPGQAFAQAVEDDGGDSPFGIGVQSSWPAYGISGLYDVNDRITAQLVLGAFGTLTTVSGRGLYHFNRMPKYSMFGFGSVGLWRYGVFSESAVGVGGGAGVELNWKQILAPDDADFPPLFSNLDIGVNFANFDTYTGFNVLSIGGGLHYRF